MDAPATSIGVDVDDFRLSIKEGLRAAAGLDFRAVEFGAMSGEAAPSNLSSSGRRHLAHFVDRLGLRVASLAADAPGLRLTDPQTAEQRVGRTCQIIDLAVDLKVSVVTASIGALTHPETGEPSPLAIEALRRIGEHADARGPTFAIRPSYDSGDRLLRVLDELRCPSIGICLDPAAMVMTGANPMASIDRFIEQIALVHARDGTAGRTDQAGHETGLGEGDVDLVGILEALNAAEYKGAHILRRIDSQTPTEDLEAARVVLARFLERR